MDEHAHVTPISPGREHLDRWINDTKLGYRVAHWVGRRIGEKSLQSLIDLAAIIPWTPLRRPIAQATVALAGTGGFHLCTDTHLESSLENIRRDMWARRSLKSAGGSTIDKGQKESAFAQP